MQSHIHAILLVFCDAWFIRRRSLYDSFLFLIQTTGSCGVWTEQKGVGRDNSSLQAFEIDGEMRMSER